MGLQAEVLESVAALDRHLTEWDALAVARGRPYCAPGWMLSWLHTAAPSDALLRVCAVSQGEELLGVAPFWTRDGPDGGRYGLLAEGTSYPLEPLCVEGREPEVAAAVRELLAEARPHPREIELRGVPSKSLWPQLLAEPWPGSSPVRVTTTRTEPVPKVGLRHPNMSTWLATRSRNFRHQLRRGRRQLDEAGAEFRMSTPGERDGDIDSLARLHHARWSAKGGSGALDSGVEAMLKLAGRELDDERFRLLSIYVDGVSISAHLFVCAGATRAYWLGGFDDRWKACRPSIQVLAAAVEDGIQRGEEWLELGPGGQHYKYRLADSEDGLAWVTLTRAEH